MMDLIDVALGHAGRGWAVFPLLPRSKVPNGKLAWKGFHQATTDEAQIREWWGKAPASNVGIACGMSGLFVIDCDWYVEGSKEAFDGLLLELGGLPRTYSVRTPQGGEHLYYRLPDVAYEPGPKEPKTPFVGKLGVGLDVRASGAYVVAAGSIGPNGPGGPCYDPLAPDVTRVPPVPEPVELPSAWIEKALRPGATMKQGVLEL